MANDAFEKFKSSVNRGITTISVKTSSTLEKSKIKTHIETLERDINKLFHNLGEAAYEKWVKENLDYSALDAQFEAIKQKKREIIALQAELGAIDERDNQILGTGNNPEVAITQPEAAKQESEAKFVCSNCGEQYEEQVKFCRKCGNKMSE